MRAETSRGSWCKACHAARTCPGCLEDRGCARARGACAVVLLQPHVREPQHRAATRHCIGAVPAGAVTGPEHRPGMGTSSLVEMVYELNP